MDIFDDYEFNLRLARERAERDALYRVTMGLTTLDMLPPQLLTDDICIAACTIDPIQYQYVPERVRPYFPEQLTEKCQTALFSNGIENDYIVAEQEKVQKQWNEVPEATFTEKSEFRNQSLEIYKKMDVNKDGVIDYKDFSTDPFGYKLQYLYNNDINNDGIVNNQDSVEFQKRQEEINYRLNTGDYNHDRKDCYTELRDRN